MPSRVPGSFFPRPLMLTPHRPRRRLFLRPRRLRHFLGRRPRPPLLHNRRPFLPPCHGLHHQRSTTTHIPFLTNVAQKQHHNKGK